MKISPDDTCIHPARAMDPEKFRATATGIGQTSRASRLSGSFRAQKVVDSMDPACRALVPEAEGYPAPMGELGLPGVYIGQPALEQATQPGQLNDLAKRLR